MWMDIPGKTSMRPSERMANATMAFAAKPKFLDRNVGALIIGIGCTLRNHTEKKICVTWTVVQKVAHGQEFIPPASRPGVADEDIHILDLRPLFPGRLSGFCRTQNPHNIRKLGLTHLGASDMRHCS